MACHGELLQQAFELVQKPNPTQADLRRAVSSAYYALFHLLISETVMHWRLDETRNALGRMFDHGTMANASNRILDPREGLFKGTDSRIYAADEVKKASDAFETWNEIRDEKVAQDYLVSLLIKHRK
jgi:hypothetical protein